MENENQTLMHEAVVIGVSSGGLTALSKLLPRLQKDFKLAVIIVQHLHPHSDDFIIRNLDEKCCLKVKQAEEKEKIVGGTIYIAPPNYHLLIELDKTFSLDISARVCFSRPSVDVMFETAAEAYKEKLIGIVLTGANDDGSAGLRKIKSLGGLTIVQDPLTAEVDIMPKSAFNSTQIDYVLNLEKIGDLLNRISHCEMIE